ncbi:hypothetical protein GJ688_17890 [Heliobacillus mobilis]|uniref:Uncharacterized protein n=1 Tax=Heliobacterium mobile TaxID=28064 RepID=A0A6I3SQ02_HELMO|nr:hypothetical protein [Heliobacterium mobile]MTV50806.1 hypothetical protein [Heliobacterium mobile]
MDKSKEKVFSQCINLLNEKGTKLYESYFDDFLHIEDKKLKNIIKKHLVNNNIKNSDIQRIVNGDDLSLDTLYNGLREEYIKSHVLVLVKEINKVLLTNKLPRLSSTTLKLQILDKILLFLKWVKYYNRALLLYTFITTPIITLIYSYNIHIVYYLDYLINGIMNTDFIAIFQSGLILSALIYIIERVRKNEIQKTELFNKLKILQNKEIIQGKYNNLFIHKKIAELKHQIQLLLDLNDYRKVS